MPLVAPLAAVQVTATQRPLVLHRRKAAVLPEGATKPARLILDRRVTDHVRFAIHMKLLDQPYSGGV